MSVPVLFVELRDYRDTTSAEWAIATHEFFDDCRSQFLDRFGGASGDMCDNVGCEEPIQNAYIDHVDGGGTLTYLEFSEQNAAQLVPDHVQYPHLTSFFWSIHDVSPTGQGERIGVLHVGQVIEESRTASKIVLTGHPVMTLPDGVPSNEERSLELRWGLMMRWLLQHDFEPVSPSDPEVEFIGWDLPGCATGAYVARPGNDFGKLIYDAASPGFSNTFHPSGAPKTVRRNPT